MHASRQDLVNFLLERIGDRGETPRSVSLALGKSPTYVSDFTGSKASPKALPEEFRRDLARFLETDEDNLRYQRVTVRGALGITPDNVSAAKVGRRPGRANDMSMGDIYTRIGKLEQRIEQLEAGQAASKGKKPSHP
jgi:hypothetical protein